jgi:hypothetical protein
VSVVKRHSRSTKTRLKQPVYLDENKKVCNPKETKRKCYKCGHKLDWKDFHYTNKYILPKETLIEMWTNPDTEFYCCICFSRFIPRELNTYEKMLDFLSTHSLIPKDFIEESLTKEEVEDILEFFFITEKNLAYLRDLDIDTRPLSIEGLSLEFHTPNDKVKFIQKAKEKFDDKYLWWNINFLRKFIKMDKLTKDLKKDIEKRKDISLKEKEKKLQDIENDPLTFLRSLLIEQRKGTEDIKSYVRLHYLDEEKINNYIVAKWIDFIEGDIIILNNGTIAHAKEGI